MNGASRMHATAEARRAEAVPARPDAARARPSNAMTVDVEDYFQVQAFSGHIGREAWDGFESRVERNTDRVLDLFEANGVRATFFTLGWVAERHKTLVRRIVADGHELASHGLDHTPIFRQSPAEFRADIRRTKALLEEIGGAAVQGYRAASFSLSGRTPWAFDILAEEGYRYSSSVYPIRHDHYGTPDAPRVPYRPIAGPFLEIPLSTIRAFGRNLPCSGGGYFRLLPYAASRWALRRLNDRDRQPAIFYFHPWEVDPAQPRQAKAPLKSRFRHYVNLGRMERRLTRLLQDFAWDRMDRVFLDGGARR